MNILVNRTNSIEGDIIDGPFYGWSIHKLK